MAIVKMKNNNLYHKIIRRVRREFAKHVLYGRFPYAYAHYYYWESLRKELNYKDPKDINEKLFWLARYWQDPRIVRCADKLAVREYIVSLGLEYILNKVYYVYEKVEDIDFDKLPDKFVLKTNHCGGGINMVICNDKFKLDRSAAIDIITNGLKQVVGIPTCEYHYQYIEPRAYAEKYIGDEHDERLEIQLFCFNGVARHILVRNDLGHASSQTFAISYDMNWNRVCDRKNEDMTIDIPRPKKLDEMIEIANKLANSFPHVRVDLYYVNEEIIFGEMTFTTSGNILWNYKHDTREQWGRELVLPRKLEVKWRDVFVSQLDK